MGGDVLLFNFIVYLVTTLLFWKKRACLDLYLLLWIAYTIIAFLGWYGVYVGIFGDDTHLGERFSFFPYLCCYITTFLVTFPFKDLDVSRIEMDFENSNFFYILIFVLTICFVLTGILKTINAYVVANTIGFGQAYDIGHYGGTTDIWRNNELVCKFYWLSSFLVEPLKPLYVVFFMLRLTKRHGKKLLNILCIFVAFWPQLVSGVASKGSLFFLVMDIMFFYILFRNKIPADVKRLFGMLGSMMFAGLIVYVLAIQVSRLEEHRSYSVDTDDANEALLHYLGEPYVNLGTEFYGYVRQHPMGKRFYPYLFPDSDNKEKYDEKNQQEMFDYWTKYTGVEVTLFSTFWGDFYIEFGTFGSFLAIIGLLSFFYFLCFKEYWRLSKFPIVLYFYHYIAVWSLFTAEGQQGTNFIKSLLTIMVVAWLIEKYLSIDSDNS